MRLLLKQRLSNKSKRLLALSMRSKKILQTRKIPSVLSRPPTNTSRKLRQATTHTCLITSNLGALELSTRITLTLENSRNRPLLICLILSQGTVLRSLFSAYPLSPWTLRRSRKWASRSIRSPSPLLCALGDRLRSL
jgi:hypothetical protein